MKIFSSVYRQCNKLKEKLCESVVLPNSRSEGEYRSKMNHALGSPIVMRYDELMIMLSVRLMEENKLNIPELIDILLKKLLILQDMYGDSFNYPIRAFTDMSVLDQINLKLDDKLCIVYNSRKQIPSDVYEDIICYIIIYKTLVTESDERFYRRIKYSKLAVRNGIYAAMGYMFMLAGILLIFSDKEVMGTIMNIIGCLVLYGMSRYKFRKRSAT